MEGGCREVGGWALRAFAANTAFDPGEP